MTGNALSRRSIIKSMMLDVAKSLENRCRVSIDMWDVIEENVPKKYEGGNVCLRKLYYDDCFLSCIE
ncbi:hypothetical protein H5410_028339 [Solanum commersonii]|uniref:Uncharacterized protein n=1 Tax=Solanum commersonii TaxID=4109 RepID=A0A9J5Z4N2_SOLCO|nr:hypothetical protein H5410_028339 [Solanum commersonii]